MVLWLSTSVQSFRCICLVHSKSYTTSNLSFHFSSLCILHTSRHSVDLQCLLSQQRSSLNEVSDVFSSCHDPITHAHRARFFAFVKPILNECCHRHCLGQLHMCQHMYNLKANALEARVTGRRFMPTCGEVWLLDGLAYDKSQKEEQERGSHSCVCVFFCGQRCRCQPIIKTQCERPTRDFFWKRAHAQIPIHTILSFQCKSHESCIWKTRWWLERTSSMLAFLCEGLSCPAKPWTTIVKAEMLGVEMGWSDRSDTWKGRNVPVTLEENVLEEGEKRFHQAYGVYRLRRWKEECKNGSNGEHCLKLARCWASLFSLLSISLGGLVPDLMFFVVTLSRFVLMVTFGNVIQLYICIYL